MVDFKSSFIPRRPILENIPEKRLSRHGRLGPLNILGIAVLLLTLVGYGGLFGYTYILQNDIREKTAEIEQVKREIDPEAINDLKKFDARLALANQILKNHVVLNTFFEFLEARTLTFVRFENLSYELEEEGASASIQMRGESKGYSPLVLQSDEFLLNGFMVTPIFSNLRLNQEGNVDFDLAATIGSQSLLYEETVNADTRLNDDLVPINPDDVNELNQDFNQENL